MNDEIYALRREMRALQAKLEELLRRPDQIGAGQIVNGVTQQPIAQGAEGNVKLQDYRYVPPAGWIDTTAIVKARNWGGDVGSGTNVYLVKRPLDWEILTPASGGRAWRVHFQLIDPLTVNTESAYANVHHYYDGPDPGYTIVVHNPLRGCPSGAGQYRYFGAVGCRGLAEYDSRLSIWWIYDLDC